jgi:hypothetical protein
VKDSGTDCCRWRGSTRTSGHQRVEKATSGSGDGRISEEDEDDEVNIPVL